MLEYGRPNRRGEIDENENPLYCLLTLALAAFAARADVRDIPDGTTATIKIVEKDDDGQDDDVSALTTTVSGGKIECAWKVVYMENDDDADSEREKAEKGYTLPEYAFTVECGGVTSEESSQLSVRTVKIVKIVKIGKTGSKLLKQNFKKN